MVHADGDDPIGLLRPADDAAGPVGVERKRLFDEDMQAGREGREQMHFVEMVRGADEDGVEFLVPQQLLDVVVHVVHAVPVGKRPRLRQIGVAQRGDLDSLGFAQHGEVSDLEDRTGADDAESECISHVEARGRSVAPER